MYKRLNGETNVFHEHLQNGRKLKSLRIGPDSGQTLNMVSGGILPHSITQNSDYETKKMISSL